MFCPRLPVGEGMRLEVLHTPEAAILSLGSLGKGFLTQAGWSWEGIHFSKSWSTHLGQYCFGLRDREDFKPIK